MIAHAVESATSDLLCIRCCRGLPAGADYCPRCGLSIHASVRLKVRLVLLLIAATALATFIVGVLVGLWLA
jgi:predicted amidophosphoribosyltransferase